MKALPIERMGDKVQGVHLFGDPKRPEPDHFRVVFPFGDLDIARCDDGTYWVHLCVHRPEQTHSDPADLTLGRFVDGRVDSHHRHASETRDLAEPLNQPGIYHLAVRIGPEPKP